MSAPVAHLRFVGAWLRRPREVGAVVPSGRVLCERMAAEVDPARGLVVELGAGTGSVTGALLRSGVPSARLIPVEKDEALARALKRRYPRLRVLHGDATRLRALLRQHDIAAPATIVSSLPLLSLRVWQRLRVLKEIAALLPTDGLLVQFTYSPRPPIDPSLARALGLEGRRARRVLKNLPPASVWVYRKVARKRDGKTVHS